MADAQAFDTVTMTVTHTPRGTRYITFRGASLDQVHAAAAAQWTAADAWLRGAFPAIRRDDDGFVATLAIFSAE